VVGVVAQQALVEHGAGAAGTSLKASLGAVRCVDAQQA
jgi:hypothetical protein